MIQNHTLHTHTHSHTHAHTHTKCRKQISGIYWHQWGKACLFHETLTSVFHQTVSPQTTSDQTLPLLLISARCSWGCAPCTLWGHKQVEITPIYSISVWLPLQTERRLWNSDTALASLQPLHSDVCKYMENTEVWERIHFTQSPYVLRSWAQLPTNSYPTVPSVSLSTLSALDRGHEQVRLGSNGSITMNRAPSSVACRVWESCSQVFVSMLTHSHVGCVSAVFKCFHSH